MFGQREKTFGLPDNISSKDVKFSFYVSIRTIWGNFCLKFCKISIFFGHWAKLSLNKTGERHREDSSETFVSSKDLLRRPFLTFPKVCWFEKQNVGKASRYFFWSLLSHSNRCFSLWDFLSVHAIVWQRLHLCALKWKRWRMKKYRKWCDFEKKE